MTKHAPSGRASSPRRLLIPSGALPPTGGALLAVLLWGSVLAAFIIFLGAVAVGAPVFLAVILAVLPVIGVLVKQLREKRFWSVWWRVRK